MRRAIEKLSFLFISFAAASVLSFALLARIADQGALRRATLPVLLNTSPRDARELSLVAVREAAGTTGTAAHGRGELARLGGAALPHVLPLFESLDPAARGRVALALAPVARRMGVGGDEDFKSAERAVVFFTRFWQDRSADFRAAVVRRKVQRLAERSLPLRRKEVAELDTFALGELFDALGRVRTREDAERIERLHPLLSHITGAPVVLPPKPSIEQAARAAVAWRDFAFEQGADFTTLDGPGRLAAMVFQTRYFGFLQAIPRAVRGDDPAGAAKLREVLARAQSTVPLTLFSLALAVIASTLVSRWLAARSAAEHWLARLALFGSAIPLAALASRGSSLGAVSVLLLLALGLTAALVLEQGSAGGRRGGWTRALARAGTLLPLALAAELAAEVLGGRGLGGLTRHALGERDLDGLMWIALVLSATGSLGILMPDARPSLGPEDSEEPGEVTAGRRRPVVIGAAVGVVTLLALAALGQASLPGQAGLLARAAGVTLLTTGATLAAAAAVALLLGLAAGGLSRAAELLLARAIQITSALPQPLVACAAFTFGSVAGAAFLGVLRGIEVSHVLRVRLAEQRAARELEPPSLGRAPFSPYLRRVLPAAVGPAAISLALSGSWLASLEGAGATLGAPTTASLSALAMGSGWPATAALFLLTLLTSSLCLLAQDVSPRESHDETHSGPVVIALRRRIDSSRPGPSS